MTSSKNIKEVHDIHAYVGAKLYLVNMLTGNHYTTLFEALSFSGPSMNAIVEKLSYRELDYLISKIENIL